jgi:voltage-gated potassium channel
VAQHVPGIKVRYRDFVARHEVAWELTFGVLAAVFVALAFVPVTPGSSADKMLYALEWLITAVFIAEFSSRLWAAESRRDYLRGHWIDLVSCIPPVRWARFFRLFRLLRLVRTFAGIGRAMTHVERLANHRGLMWLIIAWVAVMLLCAVGLFVVENGVNAAVDGPLDALWWGLTTMTTVGYGDVFPTTAEGRLVAAVLMILGIGLYSIITATVTSFLIADDRAGPADLAGQLERLAVLHADGRVTDHEYRAAKAAVIG